MALPFTTAPNPTARVRRRTAACAVPLTAAALVAALAGCDISGENRLTFSDTEKVKITEVRIGPGGSGDVRIRTSDIAEVRINRVVRYRGDEPAATYRLEGTVLHAATACGDFCSVDYDIEAPAGVAVRGEQGSGDLTLTGVASTDVELGSGDVTLTGVSGPVVARTGSGDVTATDLRGTVSLNTGSGDIEADRLSGGAVSVEAGSGNVDLALDRAAGVRAKTGSGNVTLVLPPDSYRVKATTNSGERRIGITDDPQGRHLLQLDTTSGNISVATP